MPKLIFMYGFPASGKTTYAKKLAAESENTVYLAADEVRSELYGSQDHFGEPETIYKILLNRMMAHLENGKNVVYDACNLYKQFRMDYLKPIQDFNISCQKILIRMNTTKETCLANHAKRGRKFDINDVMHYFELTEYPTASEGWDDILDVPDHAKTPFRVFMPQPSMSFADMWPDSVYADVKEHLRANGYTVTSSFEHARRETGFIETTVAESDAVVQIIASATYMKTQLTKEAEDASRCAGEMNKPTFGICVYDNTPRTHTAAIAAVDSIIDTLKNNGKPS